MSPYSNTFNNVDNHTSFIEKKSKLIYNPFTSFDIPSCPKCVKDNESLLLFCCFSTDKLNDSMSDHWTHIKCSSCNCPSVNGFICDKLDKASGNPHGIYSNPNYPEFKQERQYYCQNCYYDLNMSSN